jgi:hypothetical protein
MSQSFKRPESTVPKFGTEFFPQEFFPAEVPPSPVFQDINNKPDFVLIIIQEVYRLQILF